MLSVFFCEKLKKFKTNIDKCAYMVYNISTIKKTNKSRIFLFFFLQYITNILFCQQYVHSDQTPTMVLSVFVSDLHRPHKALGLCGKLNLTKQNATSTFTVSYSATNSHKTYYSYIIAYLICFVNRRLINHYKNRLLKLTQDIIFIFCFWVWQYGII